MPSKRFIVLLMLAGAAVGLGAVAYRPDRPVPTIEPGSSDGPAFVVQIIRPRSGLPLGGLLPPKLFGVDAQLVWDSSSPGAEVRVVEPGRVELSTDGCDLVLDFDADGRMSSSSEVVFDLVFEDELRRVRCRPEDPANATISTVVLAGAVELSGRFDIELSRCEDAGTGEPLDWPLHPLVLHGSFDRLPLNSELDD